MPRTVGARKFFARKGFFAALARGKKEKSGQPSTERKVAALWLETERNILACDICSRRQKKMVDGSTRGAIDFFPRDGRARNMHWLVWQGASLEELEAEKRRCHVLCSRCVRMAKQARQHEVLSR